MQKGRSLEYITARSALSDPRPGTSWRASARFFPTVCMANRRPSGGELTPEQSSTAPTFGGTQPFRAALPSGAVAPPRDDEALFAGWSRLGRPNEYNGPSEGERADLAEGEGGRHYRRGERTQQERLRNERKRLRKADRGAAYASNGDAVADASA